MTSAVSSMLYESIPTSAARLGQMFAASQSRKGCVPSDKLRSANVGPNRVNSTALPVKQDPSVRLRNPPPEAPTRRTTTPSRIRQRIEIRDRPGQSVRIAMKWTIEVGASGWLPSRSCRCETLFRRIVCPGIFACQMVAG